MNRLNQKLRVGVLGGTGLVGQLFVEYLAAHPWFELVTITGSDRTVGKHYADAVEWLCESDLPEAAGSIVVTESVPSTSLDLVLSALHSDAAASIEPQFAAAGIPVVTNASSFRMTSGVPLLIPEVNADQLSTLKRNPSGGFIVASPNCSTIGLASALAPLHEAFGIESVNVTTLQALSGAGVPGVASLHAIANVIPNIPGEEAKLETEPLKILGSTVGDKLKQAEFRISAQCNRVPVVDGHVCSVSVKLSSPGDINDVRNAILSFDGQLSAVELPNKPERLLRLYSADNHPQPRLHVGRDRGMSVGIGRLRNCPVNDVRFTALVHNTRRGAAGNAILIAELAVARGLLAAGKSITVARSLTATG